MIERLGFTPITFADYQLFLEGKLTLPQRPIIITFDDGYLDTLENAIPVLLELNMRAVIFVMGNRNLNYAGWDQLDEPEECPLMSDDQIRSVQEMGFEIGAHSLNHVSLTDLTEGEIAYEVYRSKEILENIIEKPILTFSYPYGCVDERVTKVVSNSGFLFGCGVFTGSAMFSETMMDFRRLAVNQYTSFLKFLITLILPYQYIEWAYYNVKNRLKTPAQLDHQEDLRTQSTNGNSKDSNFDMHKIFNSH
ncbi:MAG: polysaccharide deacetylase family protein [Balneolales bacterium]|nr:polysaccharide deacetylase family protein [Balneolales bacterium]